MNPFLTYLLEASFCLVVWYGVYGLLFRRATHLGFNRFFLLGATVLSVGLPLIHVSWPAAFAGDVAAPMFLERVSAQAQRLWLPEVQISATRTGLPLPSPAALGWGIYLAGMLGSAAFLVYRTAKVLACIRRGRQTQATDYRVVQLADHLPTFSFFRYLCLAPAPDLDEASQRALIAHEEAHIRGLHSWDVLGLNLVKICFWFHPAVYLIERDLRELHEFIADRRTVASQSPTSYARLLAQQALAGAGLSLTHSFHQFHIKQRITMLQKNHVPLAWWKGAAAVAIALTLGVLVSCEQDSTASAEPTAATTIAQMDEEAINQELTRYKEKYGEEIEYFTIPDAKLRELGVALPEATPADKQNIRALFDRLHELDQQNALNQSPSDEVFLVVEEQPAPVGGMEAVTSYLQENLAYPAQARRMGIEGRVFVEFIIEKDGTISNVKSVKGIGAGCDAEAVRVVSEMPNWNPGKQSGQAVKVKMVLPIMFKLDDKTSSLFSHPTRSFLPLSLLPKDQC
ncbi:M56 family metallopeptidase [Catalinimonas alkaloidigena]|nr:M56 family metallopeptidase [Catalinimonas alkaloidigena]